MIMIIMIICHIDERGPKRPKRVIVVGGGYDPITTPTMMIMRRRMTV